MARQTQETSNQSRIITPTARDIALNGFEDRIARMLQCLREIAPNTRMMVDPCADNLGVMISISHGYRLN